MVSNCLYSAKYLHAVFWSREPERVSRKGRALFVAARVDSDGEFLVSGQTLNMNGSYQTLDINHHKQNTDTRLSEHVSERLTRLFGFRAL